MFHVGKEKAGAGAASVRARFRRAVCAMRRKRIIALTIGRARLRNGIGAMRRRRHVGAGALLLAGSCACLLMAAYLAGGFLLQRQASFPKPSGASDLAWSAFAGEDEFPPVDWGHWKTLNPAVIAWINVPGTSISQPVVMASSKDPEFYLSHDVTGKSNVYGCPYVDASCSDKGLRARNCLIYGHNMSDGGMFAPFASFTDESVAQEHRTVCLQTIEKKMRLSVLAVCEVPGTSDSCRTAFESDEDFKQWYQALTADALILEDEAPERIFSFVTCANDVSRDVRIVVVCQET